MINLTDQKVNEIFASVKIGDGWDGEQWDYALVVAAYKAGITASNNSKAIAQPEQPIEPTDKQMTAGMMALLQCSSSDLEIYSLKLHQAYESDVYRVYQAMCQVQP